MGAVHGPFSHVIKQNATLALFFKKILSPHASFTISMCQGQECGNPNQDDLDFHTLDPDLTLHRQTALPHHLNTTVTWHPTVMASVFFLISFKKKIHYYVVSSILLLNINLFYYFVSTLIMKN